MLVVVIVTQGGRSNTQNPTGDSSTQTTGETGKPNGTEETTEASGLTTPEETIFPDETTNPGETIPNEPIELPDVNF